MNIDKVFLEITPVGDNLRRFGFSYDFGPGLNILTGDNSSGKSTVLSCIYYCLGLEQLLGGTGIRALSPALHQRFKYRDTNIEVLTSTSRLLITAKNGKVFQLTRTIRNGNDAGSNEIEIYEVETKKKFSKYVHAIRDHQEHGFYRWLSDIEGLEIIEIVDEEGDTSLPLYMQNIFTSSFIEQTKGWADFFSMMPSFGIKDVKSKVTEYCLGLKSLEADSKLDAIKLRKEKSKEQWRKTREKWLDEANELNLRLFGLDISPQTKPSIDKIKVVRLLEDGREVSLTDIISKNSNEIRAIEQKLEIEPTTIIEDENLIYKQKKVSATIAKYEVEIKKVSRLYDEEKEKEVRYINVLKGIDEDLKDFKDIKHISINRDWGKISSVKCPVCRSDVSDKNNVLLDNNSVEKTVSFLKSEQTTYKTYLAACSKILEQYQSAIEFYQRKVRSLRDELDDIYKDVKLPSILGVRSYMTEVTTLKSDLHKMSDFQRASSVYTDELVDVGKLYFELQASEKDLKNSKESDDERIDLFKKTFIKFLGDFDYRSNGLPGISIENKGSNKLLPVVRLDQGQPQNIRFVSSASDFVRAIWAYYFSLLKHSVRHPGFLVMDEPGQHQMKLDSVKALLAAAISSGKQVILSISQDRKYEDDEVNIQALIEELPENSYKLIHIDDDSRCISILN